MLMQGITILSNGIPMVEASRALAYFESQTHPAPPSPPTNSSESLKRTLLSPPPSPRANFPGKDSKTNQGGGAGNLHD
ncbi:hypothetical protein CRYUN_Cryun09bG0199100 [Craigia yunnanensis]